MTEPAKRRDLAVSAMALSILALMVHRVLLYWGQGWIKRPFVSYDPALIYTTNGAGYLHALLLAALALALISAVRSFDAVHGPYKVRPFFLVVFVVFAALCWMLLSAFDVGARDAVVGANAPTVFLLVLCVFSGMHPPVWRFVTRYAWLLALYSLALCAGYSVQFLLQHPGERNSSGPIIYYLVEGFFSLCIAALGRQGQTPRYRALMLALIAGCIALALLYNTRGWAVQGLLLLLLYVLRGNRRLTAPRVAKGLLLVAAASAALYLLAMQLFPAQMQAFLGRLMEDTRSRQYAELLYQASLPQLLLGQGMDAQYYSSTFGWYSYIDNQYLFNLFRYGIWIVLPYSLLLLRALVRGFFRTKGRESRILSLVVALWLMALGGLSVYSAITISIKELLLMVLAGRLYYLADGGAEDVPAEGEDRPLTDMVNAGGQEEAV